MQKKQSPLVHGLALMVLAFNSSLGVTITLAPSFVPATNAPLAGTLQITTDVESRVSVAVDDGIAPWTRNFYDFSLTHSVPLAGFKPGRTHQITVTVYDKAQQPYTAGPITFVTAPLPSDFPHWDILHSEPAKMEPGYTLFLVQNRTAKKGYLTIMNNAGEVVWYSPSAATTVYDVRQLANGNLFIEEQPPLNRFIEVNLLGETVRTWTPPAQYPINDHDGVPTAHGTILYLSDVTRSVSGFPSSATNPNAPLITTNVEDNPIVEISAADSSLVNAWSLVDLLDSHRVTYLTYEFPTPFGVDNYHANAVLEDPADGGIIVSVRDQNAVVKISRGGGLKWILGPPANWAAGFQPYLLSPVGTPFQWNYGQHAPELTAQHTLLMYDNGNARAMPFDARVPDQNNYSRAVEFSIDENNLRVAQVWDTTQAAVDRLYTPALGDADRLPQTGNVLVTFGFVTYVNGAHPSPYATNATMARIREFTHDPVPSLVFELSFFDRNNTSSTYMGALCYRSDRIPDLYAHPLTPVADLCVSPAPGGALLKFSGDPKRTYNVETSTDMQTWAPAGTAALAAGADCFQFQDTGAPGLGARFYRVVTQ